MTKKRKGAESTVTAALTRKIPRVQELNEVKEEATTDIGGRESIDEEKDKAQPPGARNFAPLEGGDVNANANVDSDEDGAQRNSLGVRLEPPFSKWLLPGEELPPLPQLTDLALVLALYHNSSSEDAHPIQNIFTETFHPRRFQELSKCGDAHLLNFCNTLLPCLFGHRNFGLLGIIISHAKSNHFFQQLARAYNFDAYVANVPSRGKQWADIWEAYIGAVILERSMWNWNGVQKDCLKDVEMFMFEIWRIRYRALMVYSTIPGSYPHVKTEALQSIRGNGMKKATEQSLPQAMSQTITETESKSIPRMSASNPTEQRALPIQITTESIIYPTDPLLSRILLPKPDQPGVEIGVIATLKLEDYDGAKGEEIEKEQRDGKEGGAEITAFGTNIKDAIARVKSLHSSITRGSRGMTGRMSANEKRTSNIIANNTSIEYINGIMNNVSSSFGGLISGPVSSLRGDPPVVPQTSQQHRVKTWQSLIQHARYGHSQTFPERLLSSFNSKYQEWMDEIEKIESAKDRLNMEQVLDCMMIKLRIQWNQSLIYLHNPHFSASSAYSLLSSILGAALPYFPHSGEICENVIQRIHDIAMMEHVECLHEISRNGRVGMIKINDKVRIRWNYEFRYEYDEEIQE